MSIPNLSVPLFKVCRRKLRKTVYFHFFKFQKRHNAYKNWQKWTALELDRMFIRRKWHAKFQLNMTKHVEEGRKTVTDGQRPGRRPGRTDRRTDITIPWYVPSEDRRIKRKISDLAPWQKPLYKQSKWQHKIPQMADDTSIAYQFRTVSWSNESHTTGMVNLFAGPTFPLPTTTV